MPARSFNPMLKTTYASWTFIAIWLLLNSPFPWRDAKLSKCRVAVACCAAPKDSPAKRSTSALLLAFAFLLAALVRLVFVHRLPIRDSRANGRRKEWLCSNGSPRHWTARSHTDGMEDPVQNCRRRCFYRAETNITLLPPPAIFLLAVATLLRPGPVVHKVSVVDRPADHIPKALTVPRSFSFFAANNEKVLR